MKSTWRAVLCGFMICVFALQVLFVPMVAEADSVVIKPGDRGDNVILLQMRLRDLGYYKYKITGYFGDMTVEAVKEFQGINKLTKDGTIGENTSQVLFSNDAKRAPVKEVVKPTPVPTPAPTKKPASNNSKPASNTNSKYGEMKDWFDWVLPRFARGDKVKMRDFYTGITLNMIRVGGSLHADVEPATKADTAKLKKIYNNRYNATRRPVVVTIRGVQVAGSLYGEPHGYETIANNDMNGQVCIHFLNSRTHIRNMKDANHQRCVRIAAGK